MGIPVFQPYLFDNKRLKTKLGEFQIESFDVPHSVPCRAFIITVDETKILYASDFEYIGYQLNKQHINVALIEANYQQKFIDKADNNHLAHVVQGHASVETTADFLATIKSHLRKVILCHYSRSGNINKDESLDYIKSKVHSWTSVEWAIPGTEVDLNEVPF